MHLGQSDDFAGSKSLDECATEKVSSWSAYKAKCGVNNLASGVSPVTAEEGPAGAEATVEGAGGVIKVVLRTGRSATSTPASGSLLALIRAALKTGLTLDPSEVANDLRVAWTDRVTLAALRGVLIGFLGILIWVWMQERQRQKLLKVTVGIVKLYS